MKKILALLFAISVALLALMTQLSATELNLKAHDMNYIVPVSKYSINGENYAESKYQISIEWELFNYSGWELDAAYTQRSWWDTFNERRNSQSFRESNYNPSLFIRSPVHARTSFDLGYSHESNGHVQQYTRSWDKFFVNATVEFDPLVIGLNYWDVFMTENEGIEPYFGHFAAWGKLKIGDLWIHAVYNPKFQEINVTVPTMIFNDSYWLYQHRQGYFDSLIDYSHYAIRHGIGFALSR